MEFEIDRTNGMCLKKQGRVMLHRTVIDDADEYVIEDDFDNVASYAHNELQLKRVVAIIRPAEHDRMVEAKEAGMHFEKDVVYHAHEGYLFVKSFA